MSKEFEELEARARGLDAEHLAGDLAGLATDPRFAAVVGWLLERERRFVAEAIAPVRSLHHGPMAHAAGGAYATRALLDDLRERLSEGPQKRRPRPEDGD